MTTELLNIQEAYISMITESDVELDSFVESTKKEHPELKALYMHPRGDDIKLDTIAIHKEHQGSGVGSKVIEKIKDFADTHKKRVILTAGVRDKDFGTTSQSRLDKFYKKHGFIPNKGKSKDFSLTATHIYNPK
jgi:GNAT superfamily N-acetyltransferase